MPKVTFRCVNDDNFKAVIRLSDTLSPYQKTCVADNAISLAQAYLHRKSAWPRAIYAGKEPVGFIMVNLNVCDFPEEDRPSAYLWRFMIAGPHQGKGYGRAALDELVARLRKQQKKTLYLSCEMEGPMPYEFYLKYGFLDTNTVEDGEEVLKLFL